MKVNSITIIELKESMSKQLYCKRCGVLLKKPHLQIQLTPKRLIDVCVVCFEWARDKTPTEIKKDYKERASRKIK